MRKSAIYSIIILFGATLSGCGQDKAVGTSEKAEEVSADVTAAQIEGRNAAREFVNRAWKDTMDLQNQVLAAKSRKAKYEAKGFKEAAAAYDSAFISTIRTVRPDLYDALKTEPTAPAQ